MQRRYIPLIAMVVSGDRTARPFPVPTEISVISHENEKTVELQTMNDPSPQPVGDQHWSVDGKGHGQAAPTSDGKQRPTSPAMAMARG